MTYLSSESLDPSLAAIYSAMNEAVRRVATPDFAERHAQYLAQAGFVQIESGTRVYTIGGSYG